MEEFLRKFTQLNGEITKIIIGHCLFGKQTFYCDKLQTINDDKRIGVIIKEREIFMDKQDIKIAEVKGDMFTVSDGRLTITVIINKLLTI
jgi:hypothetical protein